MKRIVKYTIIFIPNLFFIGIEISFIGQEFKPFEADLGFRDVFV